MNDTDNREFRNALGQFATGVTIITTSDSSANPFGITVNSFSSVSLDPKLVLWSLAKSSRNYEAFQQADYYVIHVLKHSQKSLSNHFATAVTDPFIGLDYTLNDNGIPLLPEYAARFECRAQHQHEGGDHIILLGEVSSFDRDDNSAPLIFHGGRYCQLENS